MYLIKFERYEIQEYILFAFRRNANRAFNIDEIFMDKNAVGINPFQKLTPDQGQKLHTIG